MNKQILSVLIVLSFLGGWALLKKRPTPVSQTVANEEAPESESTPMQKTRSPAAAAASNPLVSFAVPQRLDSNASSAAGAARVAGKYQTVPAETLKDLRDFHAWHSKPFLSEEEEQRKKEMLQNPAFLRKLGDLLVTTDMMKDPKFEEAENAALDLLVESLKNGDRGASMEVIQNVVRDNQVENPQLPTEVREVLAGAKAELLFHAVALAPQEFANISSLLPGPVSQNIWANVQAKHRQNLAESQVEVQQYQQAKAGRH